MEFRDPHDGEMNTSDMPHTCGEAGSPLAERKQGFVSEPAKSDISYVTGSSKFNYRVSAVIIRGESILAMRDERSPYYYLPGGRVKLNETAEDAVLRELREELGVSARIERLLWLDQSFFREDVDGLHYHELCIYFLIDANGTGLMESGEEFTLREREHTHRFEWLPFAELREKYFYPLFLKEEIFSLPERFTLRTDFE